METDKIQKRKKTVKFIQQMVYFVIIVLGVAGMCYATYIHTLGFHNLDIAYNIRALSYETGFEWVDYYAGDDIKHFTHAELWNLGVKQIMLSFLLMAICVLMFWNYFICWTMSIEGDGKDELFSKRGKTVRTRNKKTRIVKRKNKTETGQA